MPQTLKQNRRPQARAANRNGAPSLAVLANAAQKKAVLTRNGKTITLGMHDSDILVDARSKAVATGTARKPRKFVHVAPKATAQEILDDLGIKPSTVERVRKIIRDLEMKGKL